MNDLAINTDATGRTRRALSTDINSIASAVMDPLKLRKLVFAYRAPNVLSLLREHGMVELCDFNDHTIPVSLGALIEDQCKLSASMEMLRQQELRHVFSALEDACLKNILVFRGTALAYKIYRSPWRRPRDSTKILVAPDLLATIVSVLRDIDYQFLPRVQACRATGQAIMGKKFNDHAHHILDIRCAAGNHRVLGGFFTQNELLKTASPLKEISRIAQSPSSVDELLIAALYIARNGCNDERLIWYYDIQVLLNRLSGEERKSLGDICRKKGVMPHVNRVLERTARLFGEQVL